MKEKVVLGMSGGVDSSVSAYLLQKDYDVLGVHMTMCNDDPEKEEIAIRDGETVAKQLGIPYETIDVQKDFHKHVIDYFITEYKAGRTPNPCVECNRTMKWKKLFNYADEHGAKYVATGHYGKVLKLPNGRLTIESADYQDKDQSYVLYQLQQDEIERILLPLGPYEKPKIREIGKDIGLATSSKAESQDICFIPDGDYGAFINERTTIPPKGNFVDINGNILGEHKGIIHYTIGQRKGLGLALGYPAYVLEIRPQTNEVVVGKDEEGRHNGILVDDLNFLAMEDLEEELRVLVRIRYNHKGTYGTIRKTEDGKVIVHLEEAIRAITPGQSAVFYTDNYLVGGGTIVKSLDL